MCLNELGCVQNGRVSNQAFGARVLAEPVPSVQEGCLRKHVLYQKYFERDGNQQQHIKLTSKYFS